MDPTRLKTTCPLCGEEVQLLDSGDMKVHFPSVRAPRPCAGSWQTEKDGKIVDKAAKQKKA